MSAQSNTAIELPGIRSFYARDVALSNHMDGEARGEVKLTVQLSHHLDIGVQKADEHDFSPVVRLNYSFKAWPEHKPDGDPPLVATAQFMTVFDRPKNATLDQVIELSKTGEARGLALQALAVANRAFRQQLALIAIDLPLTAFPPLGEIGVTPAPAKPTPLKKTQRRTKSG